MSVAIEDLGGRVASVWSELRPATRKLVERALQPAQAAVPRGRRPVPYDARADLELSQLLTVLDEGVSESGLTRTSEKKTRLREIADTCAGVLFERTQSAEVFVQLIERAQLRHDYSSIDELANALNSRFAPSETCELARSANTLVRALAQDSLTQTPTPVLIALLHDPVDSDVARAALDRQAREFGSEDARDLMGIFDHLDLNSGEL